MTVLEFAVDLPCKVAICARKWSSQSLEYVSLLGVYPEAAHCWAQTTLRSCEGLGFHSKPWFANFGGFRRVWALNTSNRYTQSVAAEPSILKKNWKLSALAWEETTKRLSPCPGWLWIISPRVSGVCCEAAVRDEVGSCQTILALWGNSASPAAPQLQLPPSWAIPKVPICPQCFVQLPSQYFVVSPWHSRENVLLSHWKTLTNAKQKITWNCRLARIFYFATFVFPLSLLLQEI